MGLNDRAGLRKLIVELRSVEFRSIEINSEFISEFTEIKLEVSK